MRSPFSDLASGENSEPGNELLCPICYIPYDQTFRQPLIVCPSKHQSCSVCIKALKNNKKCPFCRCQLDFSDIKLNKTLLSIIGNNDYETNDKGQILQKEDFYASRVSSEPQQNQLNQNIMAELQSQEQQSIGFLAKLIQNGRKYKFLVGLFLLLPVFILDFYFGNLDTSQTQCTLTKEVFGTIIIRTWFRIISLVQGFYLIVLILGGVAQYLLICAFDPFIITLVQSLFVLGILIKGIFCTVFQLLLFFGIMVPGCRGSIYIYGLVLTIIHISRSVILGIHFKINRLF